MLDAGDLAEFSTEVTALSELGHHPNIMRLFGISKRESDLFLIMEWCPLSLEALLTRAPPSPARGLSVQPPGSLDAALAHAF